MSRRNKLIKNILILLGLYLILIKAYGLYFTPLAAHRDSERTAHYGPSEIVHIEDFEKGKLILAKYDKWFSCNTVNRSLLFHWRFGNQVHGQENDLSKPLSYSWSGSREFYKAFGLINDDNIVKVEVILKNGDKLVEEEFYDDMFLITWEGTDNRTMNFNGIRAYDKDNNLIFEEMY